MSRINRKRKEDIGLSPYEMKFRGQKKVEKTTMELFDFNLDFVHELPVKSIDKLTNYQTKDTISWLNVNGLDDVNLMKKLAEIFSCVPSQINYVLGTRFTPSQGYVVESRRGGGGYLKIVKLSWEDLNDCSAARLPEKQQAALSQNEAEGILRRLLEEDWLTQREFQLLRMMLSRDVLLGDAQVQDVQRTQLLQAAVTALCRMDGR